MLIFEHPQILWWLLTVPVAAAVWTVLQIRRRRLLRLMMHERHAETLSPDRSTAKSVIKFLHVAAAASLLILALANPQVGTRLEEIKRQGIDLFVALDVSLSMKAEDIRPNRLDKAKRDVSSLLQRLAGDRVGLIVFAGDAYIQFPLTADYSAADLFLSAVDVDAVPRPGTMIGSAIELALRSFPSDVPTQKAIVVVSDGENTEGDVMGAVEQAVKAGVRVFTIGMGTLEGGPIPIFGAGGRRLDYKRDAAGSIVLTRLDESMLQQIAVATGGTYRRATSGGSEVDDVYNSLSALEKTEFGAKQVTGYESVYRYPLALALVLLLVEFLLSERKGVLIGRLRKMLVTAAVVAGWMLLPAEPLPAQTVHGHVRDGNSRYRSGQYADAEADYKKAQEKDPLSPVPVFNLGNAQYKQDRFDEAIRSYGNFAARAQRPSSVARALHNAGNALFRSDKLRESIEAYKQALRLKPNDEETRYNLQLALERLENQQEQNQQQQQDQQDQQRQQDQQQDQQRDQKQDQQQNQQQDRQQKAQPRPEQISKEQAERILEALKNNEQEIQKELRKREASRVTVEKDW